MKILTAIEKQMISRFTADIGTNPEAAKARLKAFKQMLRQKRSVYDPSLAGAAAAPGGAALPPQPPLSDLYSRYQRRQAPAGQ